MDGYKTREEAPKQNPERRKGLAKALRRTAPFMSLWFQRPACPMAGLLAVCITKHKLNRNA